jgi:hypothetical protein
MNDENVIKKVLNMKVKGKRKVPKEETKVKVETAC